MIVNLFHEKNINKLKNIKMSHWEPVFRGSYRSCLFSEDIANEGPNFGGKDHKGPKSGVKCFKHWCSSKVVRSRFRIRRSSGGHQLLRWHQKVFDKFEFDEIFVLWLLSSSSSLSWKIHFLLCRKNSRFNSTWFSSGGCFFYMFVMAFFLAFFALAFLLEGILRRR